MSSGNGEGRGGKGRETHRRCLHVAGRNAGTAAAAAAAFHCQPFQCQPPPAPLPSASCSPPPSLTASACAACAAACLSQAAACLSQAAALAAVARSMRHARSSFPLRHSCRVPVNSRVSEHRARCLLACPSVPASPVPTAGHRSPAMNPEKLAKMQSSARIGGKVRAAAARERRRLTSAVTGRALSGARRR